MLPRTMDIVPTEESVPVLRWIYEEYLLYELIQTGDISWSTKRKKDSTQANISMARLCDACSIQFTIVWGAITRKRKISL